MQQRDLLVGEGPDFFAEDDEIARNLIVLYQWDMQYSARAAKLDCRDRVRDTLAIGLGNGVVYCLNYAPLPDDLTKR